VVHYKPWIPTWVELLVIFAVAVVLAVPSPLPFLPWWGVSALWLAAFAVLIAASLIRSMLVSLGRRSLAPQTPPNGPGRGVVR